MVYNSMWKKCDVLVFTTAAHWRDTWIEIAKLVSRRKFQGTRAPVPHSWRRQCWGGEGRNLLPKNSSNFFSLDTVCFGCTILRCYLWKLMCLFCVSCCRQRQARQLWQNSTSAASLGLRMHFCVRKVAKPYWYWQWGAMAIRPGSATESNNFCYVSDKSLLIVLV